jgi:hypothetical protein
MGVYLMSKFTSKAMMFAVIVSAGAGQVFAAERDLPGHNEKRSWSLNCFRSCMRDAVNDVREAAPVIQQAGTAVISAATVIASAQGDEKAVNNLNKAQIVLDGAAATVAANDPRAALNIAEQTVLTVAPHAADDIEKFNGVVSQVEAVAAIVKPLVEIAVANKEKLQTVRV